MWKWIETMPSTNVRIFISLLMALATGVRVVGWGWAPPVEWLIYLAGQSGVDVLQFSAKRATYKGEL